LADAEHGGSQVAGFEFALGALLHSHLERLRNFAVVAVETVTSSVTSVGTRIVGDVQIGFWLLGIVFLSGVNYSFPSTTTRVPDGYC
jgi:hypothetical protein